MVREIDALGGIMGLNADATAIQCRMLNASKGPSVRGPRAQCDKKAYQFRLKAVCEAQPDLDLQQGSVARLLVEDERINGVETHLGVRLLARYGGGDHGHVHARIAPRGMQNQVGGRMGDASSTLSDSLRDLGFEVARFKTGTPCRLNGRSIDFSRCAIHAGRRAAADVYLLARAPRVRRPADLFTLNEWRDGMFHVEQIPCWTDPDQRAHARHHPAQPGQIADVLGADRRASGPRYCPSIEDKVVKFADKTSHQLFLEPEGRHTSEYYVNGISTSLPFEVQLEFVRTIPGLENSRTSSGRATRWSTTTARRRNSSVRWKPKRYEGLFFAGQINGTSRLRGGRRPGDHGRDQRGAEGAGRGGVRPGPGRSLHRRADR